MNVVLASRARKYLERMNEPEHSRVVAALGRLSADPPQGDIKLLAGGEGYRLRVGGYRVLFAVKGGTIIITNIVPRGQAYK